eukprot:SAG31_NODE_23578_length_501_cov_1.007463_2_plen_115_part_01
MQQSKHSTRWKRHYSLQLSSKMSFGKSPGDRADAVHSVAFRDSILSSSERSESVASSCSLVLDDALRLLMTGKCLDCAENLSHILTSVSGRLQDEVETQTDPPTKRRRTGAFAPK